MILRPFKAIIRFQFSLETEQELDLFETCNLVYFSVSPLWEVEEYFCSTD